MLILLFTLGFFWFINRTQIYAFIEGIANRKRLRHIRDIKDKKVLRMIADKTGVRLSRIAVYETQKVWGMMVGIPARPYMVLSQNALEELTKDELQWLYLHEAGHYVLRHFYKEALLQIGLVLIGISLIQVAAVSYSLVFTFILAIFLSIVYFQLARRFEYAANAFALERMDNLQGAITLVGKAKARWAWRGWKKDSIWRTLMNVWTIRIYEDQANDAKARMAARFKSASSQ